MVWFFVFVFSGASPLCSLMLSYHQTHLPFATQDTTHPPRLIFFRSSTLRSEGSNNTKTTCFRNFWTTRAFWRRHRYPHWCSSRCEAISRWGDGKSCRVSHCFLFPVITTWPCVVKSTGASYDMKTHNFEVNNISSLKFLPFCFECLRPTMCSSSCITKLQGIFLSPIFPPFLASTAVCTRAVRSSTETPIHQSIQKKKKTDVWCHMIVATTLLPLILFSSRRAVLCQF